jgi:lipoprotein NlpD
VSCARRAGLARMRGAKTLKLWPILLLTAAAGCVNSLSYEQGVYVVRPGDTLYKVAWQHGIDQRDLARWNRLRNPDLIQVGQRLRLSPPSGAPAQRTVPSQQPAPPPQQPAPRRAAPAPAPRATPPAVPPAPVLPPPQWAWPTEGQVTTRFGAPGGIATGLGIAGREGQPVRAAAAGRVVYAGSGLIGYGQLVIVKHNDTYLSAYGYLTRVLVAQGEDVTRGQTIASMGRGPERQPRLHFEIRRNGVPVDPLQLVTAR